MPRVGGESDKLGNRYEGVWTIGAVLELAAGKLTSLIVEPFGDDALGIEFVVSDLDGSRQFHSAKRQRAKGEWTLAALGEKDKRTGRSILSDLFDKLSSSGANRCCFVSSTGANDFRELAERATLRGTLADFQSDLLSENAQRLRGQFEKRILPATLGWETAYDYLQRLRVVLIDETTLTRQVNQQIALLVYRPDAREFSETEVRVLLGDFVLDHVGTEIRQNDIWDYLASFGYARRDWAVDVGVQERVRDANRSYLRTVESELINGTRVKRTEAKSIVDALTSDSAAKTVLASAPAGVGKSCVLAQVVDDLQSRSVPVVVVRMDRHGEARTSADIGRQMELPRSPTVVLAGISEGGFGVLIVDQLDAVSQVSGRYPLLWEAFDALYREAEAYPNMRLVVACRDFDLQNDQRLRKLKHADKATHIIIGSLSIEDVNAALQSAGCDDLRLNPSQKKILQVPLHLFLFIEGLGEDGPAIGFRSIGDLFDRYWDHKLKKVSERVAHSAAWPAVIDRLCEIMSRDLTLYAPAVTVDDWNETVGAMLTEHVLVRDENQIRFFHESFFDYAYARRFCASGQSLVKLLYSAEQHLFRRSQVRQVLVFLRDHARSQYLTQLRELLTDGKVRFHLKRLILAWISSLTDPTPDEWAIVEPLLADSDLGRHALPAIRHSLLWFDLLHRMGVLAKWLESPDDSLVDRALWILRFDQVQKHRSEVAADLLFPYRGRNAAWTTRLLTYFRFGSAHQSRSIQQLFLQLMDDGSFDDKSQDSSLSWCRRLDNAGDEAPLFVIEALTHWLDRSIGATVASGSTPFERHNYDQSGTRLISTVARCEPLAYAEQILPRVVAAVMRFPATSHGGLKRNATWPYPSQADPATVVDAVLAELRNALEHIARTQPDEFNRLTNDLRDTNYETLANLLLSAWAANPTRFGDVCIRFMAAEPRRLDVGYASWSGRGDGSAAISRTAIRACVPHASAECRSELEQTVVDFLPFGEDGDFAGATEHLLLEAMGEDHLSERGRSRLTTLRAKFPDRDVTIPPRRAGPAKVTGSPIPPNVTREFTDEQWLAAMKQYDYGREFNPKRELTGSAVELSRLLQLEARLNRPRFAALVARMDDSIRPEYFEAILDGLCGLDNLSKEERATDDEDFERLDPEVVFGVLRRLHQLPHHPCGRCICRAFERLASRPFSDADLEILAHYALDDPDPASEHWLEHNSAAEDDRVQNAHFSGYNSVRGLAARAISAILFSDYSYSTHLLPVLQKMVCDPLMSVRTCVAEALLPLLNHDRDEAVRLFLDNCRGADVVFGCYTFEEFIRYATSTHYAQLRDVLLTELNSRTPSSMRAAARQTCLAAFVDDAAEADANLVRTGPDALRRAAAEVYAYNLADATIGPVCREHLARLFSDPSEDVRNEAADCFRHLENADFNEFADFIRSYIESPAFPSQHDDLLRRLEDSTWQLPDITLRLAERFIASCGASAGDISTAAAGDATPVSKLVIRLYVQSGDEGIRTRCLDLIDAMERFGFYGIDSQLAEHDR